MWLPPRLSPECWWCLALTHNDKPSGRIPCRGDDFSTVLPSQARRAPDGEPPGQVLLDLEVALQGSLHLKLQRAVPALAVQRRERVERAPFVQVDQAQPPPAVDAEADQRAQQLGSEAVVDQRGVDRVQVGDQVLHLAGQVRADQPGEAE